jgi:cAMP-dependent protein kinase regulator
MMETTIKKRNIHKGFLQNVSILEALSENERLQVADALKPVEFKDGEIIIKQGDAGNMFYIIEEGNAICTKQSSPNEPILQIGELSTGSYFGEIALMTSRPRQATVTANGNCKCLSLDRKTFKVRVRIYTISIAKLLRSYDFDF